VQLWDTKYYGRFIWSYVKVAMPLEKLLRNDIKYIWNLECQEVLDMLKDKLVMTPILIFPYWDKIFHVHLDASSISLGVVVV